MRDIIFRGKQHTDKMWVFGGVDCTTDKVPYICKRARYRPDTRDWNTAEYYEKNPHYTRACVEIIPETLGQYTGLNDKHGKKIFEGDIIIYNDTYKYRVFWSDNECAFYVEGVNHIDIDRLGNLYGKYSEIIGNIHDNPELLKGE